MIKEYLCPKCRSQLMVGDNIVISAKAADGSEGLIELSPAIGDYTVKFPQTLHAKTGDLLTLFCPVCHNNLASSKHINLAMVIAKDEKGKEYEIYFSQIVGEHSTVAMMGDHVELHGEHVGKYRDLFTPRQMF